MRPRGILGRMRAVADLLAAAEREAQRRLDGPVGPEHLLLAALELPDGSAQRALARVGLGAGAFRDALAREHAAALAGIGLDVPPEPVEAPGPARRPVRTRRTPAFDRTVQEIARLAEEDGSREPRGAHVLAVVAALEHGTAARAIALLGVPPATLVAAARAELAPAA